MEFLVCMLLASILTGGRVASDIIHGVKGTTPPHLERARLKAQREKMRLTARTGSRPGDDKPTFADVLRVYKGDAYQAAIDHRAKIRAEKQAGIHTPLWVKAKRFGALLVRPVGEPTPTPAPEPVAEEPPPTTPPVQDPWVVCPDCDQTLIDRNGMWEHPSSAGCPNPPAVAAPEPPTESAPAPELDNKNHEGDTMTSPVATAPAASTGEAVNYETTVNELEELAKTQRAHVDQAAAAVKAVEDAKVAISDAQQSYAPAAAAAASINEHLTALNLDTETVSHTGTIADAMPPNAVNDMFDQLEQMEAAAKEQHQNAEVALASTEAALAVVVAKYGDANNTVASELGGDSRFLSSTAA